MILWTSLHCYHKNGKYDQGLVDVSGSLLCRIVITFIQYFQIVVKIIFCLLILCFSVFYCQVYHNKLKPIRHPDEYFDIPNYDEYDLGDVTHAYNKEVAKQFQGYWMVADNSSIPNNWWTSWIIQHLNVIYFTLTLSKF